jgi:hypothetical protein
MFHFPLCSLDAGSTTGAGDAVEVEIEVDTEMEGVLHISSNIPVKLSSVL